MFIIFVGVFVFGFFVIIVGGVVGVVIGGNYVFVFIGFCVLVFWGVFVVIGNIFGLDYLVFGFFMGLYIVFVGGVVVVIYVWYWGYLGDGKDVNILFVGIGYFDIFCVGVVFGIFGYLC